MDFDRLLTKYRTLWQEEQGERDEATYQAIVEALEQDTPLDALHPRDAQRDVHSK